MKIRIANSEKSTKKGYKTAAGTHSTSEIPSSYAREIKKRQRRFSPRDAASRARDKERFLKVFEKVLSPGEAAKIINRDRDTVMQWKRDDPEFAAKWDAIWQTVIDGVERTAMRHAMQGYRRPVYQGGKLVGYEKVHHPNIQIFMLSKNRKQTYGTDIEQQIVEMEAQLARLKAKKELKDRKQEAKSR